MNRLVLTLQHPSWRLWAEHYIYFYTASSHLACILDTLTDEIVKDFRAEYENKGVE